MGPTEIGGLPAHVLLVHVVVVLVPLTAVLLAVTGCWPRARRRLGVLVPLLALAALVSVPLTTHAGEWLAARVPQSPLIRAHTQLGDTMLPWAIALFVVALLVWGQRYLPARFGSPARADAPGAAPSPAWVRGRSAIRAGNRVAVAIAAISAVVALATAVGSVVQVYRIGESGSRAVWAGHFSQQPLLRQGPHRRAG